MAESDSEAAIDASRADRKVDLIGGIIVVSMLVVALVFFISG
ncbi:MAG: hypothetical protein O7G84_00320 [Gammaproteobacteria bacterium]|nr:hypothetical protein [Gammaproteobacteria bacterium]